MRNSDEDEVDQGTPLSGKQLDPAIIAETFVGIWIVTGGTRMGLETLNTC
jgi:hypothetical protein